MAIEVEFDSVLTRRTMFYEPVWKFTGERFDG
jgi:hypothetical protein